MDGSLTAGSQIGLLGIDLAAGDGAAIVAEDAVHLVGRSETELLLFDLA